MKWIVCLRFNNGVLWVKGKGGKDELVMVGLQRFYILSLITYNNYDYAFIFVYIKGLVNDIGFSLFSRLDSCNDTIKNTYHLRHLVKT